MSGELSAVVVVALVVLIPLVAIFGVLTYVGAVHWWFLTYHQHKVLPLRRRGLPGWIRVWFREAWALTLIGLRWLETRDPSTGSAPAVAAGNALAAGIALPFALPCPIPTAVDVGGIVYLGALQIGLAYVFLMRGIRAVGAVEVSLLLLTEPLLSPLWAGLVHGERPDAAALAGCGVIFLATVAHTAASR